MTTDAIEAGGALQTVSRAVALLRCFDEGAATLSLASLTRRMGLNKATVLRLAATLEAEGLLNKDPASGAYSVSYGLLTLGRALLSPAGLVSEAQPLVAAMRDACGETVMLNIREGRNAVVVVEELSPHAVRYALGLGYRADLRFGAASLAILAFLRPDERETVLAAPMASRADGQVPTGKELRTALEKVRAKAFASTDGQRVPDAAGFAAPVFGADGRVGGALSIVMPVSRSKDRKHARACADLVHDSARDLTVRIGGSWVDG